MALSRPLPERVPWSELGPDFLTAWGYPGGKFMPEHIEIMGPTGSGKSYFQQTILTERARLRGSTIIVIATKPADKTLTRAGWPVIDQYPPRPRWRDRRRDYRKCIFWVPAPGLGSRGRAYQAVKIRDLLESLWVPDANVIVVFDEVAYIINELGLKVEVERYLREGRALGITAVLSSQRGQGLTRYMHSETSWTVIFKPKDEEDAERVAQIAGSKVYFMRVLADLSRPKHEFGLVHNVTGEVYISSLPKKPQPIKLIVPKSEAPKRSPVVA